MLAKPFMACDRCGSMMKGSSRGDLLAQCDSRRLQEPSRRARLAKLRQGRNPYDGTRVEQARDFLVTDPEVDWLALRREPAA